MAIDTRAAAEVRQLSGGNQQKVVVARWLSRDLRILVAFDPTRGIDVLTKREIYGVFRELAASGVAILFYSSDLAELLEVTHRIVALYEGRMHATIPTPAATEAGLLTALHGLPVGDGNAVRDASLNKPAVPRRDAVPSLAPIAQGVTVPPSALPGLALPGASPAPATVEPAGTAGRDRWSPRAALRIRPSWRHAQVVGVYVVLALTLLFTFLANHQALASFGIQTLAETAVPLAFAALAQMCAILVRGIDLSIGSQIALINVLAAVTMHRDPLHGYLFAVGLLVVGAAIGGLTGLLITLTRIPDIIATLATSSVLAGIALFILPTPGGSIPNGFANGLSGTVLGIPTVLILLFVVAVAVWWPFRRSVVGLRVFATGGDHAAARLAGLSIGVSRVLAYAAGGLLCALAGLVLSAQTLGGDASVGAPYTLNSIAVAVIGGAALTGGVGTAIGVIGAAFFLTELISMLFFYGVDPNLQTLLQGAILIVVMGSLGLSRLRRR
jgi:ribose/xylose/arabinose/galactoside ABC-type transport system permease subunit